MGKSGKTSGLPKVKTVRDLARLADECGISPSNLLCLASLTDEEIRELRDVLPPAPSKTEDPFPESAQS